MRLYPMVLKVDGSRCVVVGGGAVAARKAVSLMECGARVVVVSPDLTPELEVLAREGRVELLQQRFTPADLEGALIAIAATDDRAVNETVARAGRFHGVLVNVVDEPELCDFYVPASCTRGDLQIAVSTSGASPVLAKRIREELESQFGPEYEPFLRLCARLRRELQARVQDRALRNRAESEFLSSAALSLLAQGKVDEVEGLLEECLARFAP